VTPSPAPQPWRIVQLVPAASGWTATYRVTGQRAGGAGQAVEAHPVVVWALRERADGRQDVVGLIAATGSAGRLVAAVDVAEAGSVSYRRAAEDEA
jgi:hypothetical protein